jgi:peptidoglycan/xylan/chitin deacetylase (PgdA/CDA1 family)
MSNPFSVATRGKGFIPMLTRGVTIANRYGITSAKIDGAISQLSSTLEQYGCQATIPVTALALSRNRELVQKYQSKGLELAVHGLSHVDYRSLPEDIQLDHIQRAQRIFEKAGIKATGFRCPYLRWNGDTLTALKASGFAYDSSQALDLDIITGAATSSYQHLLEFYQAQTSRKSLALPRLENGLVRIPYCLPDDEALVERMKITDCQEMAELWLAMLSRVYDAGELFTLGLHPERTNLCLQALESVLKRARSFSPPVWIARLDEIAAWYQALGQSTFETRRVSSNELHMKINTHPGAAILVRSLEITAASEPWTAGYRKILMNEFTIFSDIRPFIGLSLGSPKSLRVFLQHLGYLVENSLDAEAFTYFLDRTSFTSDDERPLLADLEKGDRPLIRVARWPGAARCALAITGDVDAFTLWDYGRRILNS